MKDFIILAVILAVILAIAATADARPGRGKKHRSLVAPTTTTTRAPLTDDECEAYCAKYCVPLGRENAEPCYAGAQLCWAECYCPDDYGFGNCLWATITVPQW